MTDQVRRDGRGVQGGVGLALDLAVGAAEQAGRARGRESTRTHWGASVRLRNDRRRSGDR